MTDHFTTPIDLTIKSRWKQLTHTLPPDSPPLWQHMDDTRYFSCDGGDTNFKIDVTEWKETIIFPPQDSNTETVDPFSNPERDSK